MLTTCVGFSRGTYSIKSATNALILSQEPIRAGKDKDVGRIVVLTNFCEEKFKTLVINFFH